MTFGESFIANTEICFLLLGMALRFFKNCIPLFLRFIKYPELAHRVSELSPVP